MKFSSRLILVSGIIFALLISKAHAQYTEKEAQGKGYLSDAIVGIIINYLPQGWTFRDSANFFIIQRADSIWELNENTSNTLKEKKDDRNARIRANGKKTVAKILIRYEKKWDFIKIQEASFNNTSIISQIASLEKKYDISKLKDSKLSSKSGIVYTPVTEDDTKRLQNYYKEKKDLEQKTMKIPDYSTEKFSLFIISKTGCIDDEHWVYPDKASVETYTVLSLIREVCGK